MKVSTACERKLLIRLDCARMVYNACLGESLKRLNILRESTAYRQALKMPRGIKNSSAAKARTDAFKAADQESGFREYDLHAYAQQFGHSWLGEHLDSLSVQKVATRAFLAVQQYGFGKKGKPRFKGKGWFDSVEGKTNASGILWRGQAVRWLGLELPGIVDPQDEVIRHGLASPVKFVRIVRRKLNGRNCFYAQLICTGVPYRKAKLKTGQGTVGLDIGPSNIAIVSADQAKLERFCAPLESRQKQIRRLQRRLERSRRANNLHNYNSNGTIKAGKLKWTNSGSYESTCSQLAELHRQLAEHRQSLHGNMVNRILSLGERVKLEKVSYRSFQRNYGKSVAFRGPGSFVSQLRRKCERWR